MSGELMSCRQYFGSKWFHLLVKCVKLFECFRVGREVVHEQFDREILFATALCGIGDPASS